MSLEAYSVAVKLSLINNVSSGLLMISKGLGSTGADVDRLNTKLSSIGKQAAIGGAMFGGGLAIASLFKAPIDAAKQYELAFTKFKGMNLGAEINKQADSFARSANVLGVSAKDMMSSLSESVGLFGDFDLAKKLAPQIAGLNAANSAIFAGKVGHIDEGSTRSLMKFIDRRGGTHDEATFLRNLDLAEKMVTGSGGFIKFRDLDQFSQMGGTSFRGLSDQGILNMSLLLQEQGGAKAGTAMMSMYQNLIAGRTPKKTMALLQEYGLGKMHMETHGAVGGKPIKSLVMGNIKGSDLLQSNPPEWIKTVFLPALAAHGVTSEGAILKATNDLLSNRTASGQASIMGTQQLQLLRDANLASNAMGTSQVLQAYADDPNSKFANLTARWNDLMVNLGIAVLPIAIRVLEKITPQIISLTAWIDKNRESVRLFGIGLAVFSGFLIGGGLINMIVAAGRGFGLLFTVLSGGGGVTGAVLTGISIIGKVLMVGLRAIPVLGWVIMAVTAGIYLYRNWDAIWTKIKALWSTISPYITGVLTWIKGVMVTAWEGIKTGFKASISFFGEQWSWLFGNLLIGVKTAFKTFAGWYLTGWQTLFNALIVGLNSVLPAAYQLSKMHFADDFKANGDKRPGQTLVAPVPAKDFSRDPLIVQMNLNSKKIGEILIQQMAKEAAKPQTGTQGFDPTRSPMRPGAPSAAYARG